MMRDFSISRVVVLVVLLSIAEKETQAQNDEASGYPGIQIFQRCQEEWSSDEMAIGRINWAYRCSLIDSFDRDYFLKKRKHPTFQLKGAPWNENDPCSSAWGAPIADCPWGCYAENQHLIFDGASESLADAIQSGAKTVVSLKSLDDFDSLTPELSARAIAHFVTGETSEPLLRIDAISGESVLVTMNHPMVTNEGFVIEAQSLLTNPQMLKGVKGPLVVKNISKVLYHGLVSNLSPVDADTEANLLVAQGFIVGSLRFQNEWKRDESRLVFRKYINMSES